MLTKRRSPRAHKLGLERFNFTDDYSHNNEGDIVYKSEHDPWPSINTSVFKNMEFEADAVYYVTMLWKGGSQWMLMCTNRQNKTLYAYETSPGFPPDRHIERVPLFIVRLEEIIIHNEGCWR